MTRSGLRPSIVKRTAVALLPVVFLTLFTRAEDKPRAATPVIVKRLTLTNITADIPIATLYTPSKDGLYRLTSFGNYVSTTGTGNGVLCGLIQWTGHHDPSLGTSPLTSRTMFTEPVANGQTCLSISENQLSLHGTWIMQVNANTPITYQMSIQAPHVDTFEVYFLLERLQ